MTGGAGFIGSAVVDLLRPRGTRSGCSTISRRVPTPSCPRTSTPRRNTSGLTWRTPETTAHAVTGMDAVSHQAARVGLGVGFRDVSDYVHDNDSGTGVLLRCLYEQRWQGRFVLASSMCGLRGGCVRV